MYDDNKLRRISSDPKTGFANDDSPVSGDKTMIHYRSNMDRRSFSPEVNEVISDIRFALSQLEDQAKAVEMLRATAGLIVSLCAGEKN